MVSERQWVRRAVRVTATPSAEPSFAEEYCVRGGRGEGGGRRGRRERRGEKREEGGEERGGGRKDKKRMTTH